jgi:hypothetical protein
MTGVNSSARIHPAIGQGPGRSPAPRGPEERVGREPLPESLVVAVPAPVGGAGPAVVRQVKRGPERHPDRHGPDRNLTESERRRRDLCAPRADHQDGGEGTL